MTIDDSTTSISLGRYLSYLEDPGGELSINQILSAKTQDRFIQSEKEFLNFGYTSSAVWVKIDVESRLEKVSQALIELKQPQIDTVEFYLYHESRLIEKSISGDLLPINQRKFQYYKIVFPFDLEPSRLLTVYLKFQTRGSLRIGPYLYDFQSFTHKQQKKDILSGIFLGVLICIALYTLFYCLFIREQIYFYYFLYLLGLIMYFSSHSSLASSLFWPASPMWANIADQFFGALSCMMASVYCREFLQLKKFNLIWDRIILSLAGISFAGLLIPFVLPFTISSKIECLIAVLSTLSILGCVIHLTAKGSRSAKFFLLSWPFIVFGVIALVLRLFGYANREVITEHAIEFGVIVQALLLSLAQADKIHTMRKRLAELLKEKKTELREVSEELRVKYKKSKISDEQMQKYKIRLLEHMEEASPHRNSTISLNDISEQTRIPVHYLSQVLNISLKKNFYQFISDYRVEEVKRELAKSSHKRRNIIDIAYDAGFNSKSSFNIIFKKNVDMTPSEYRKKHSATTAIR